MKERGRVLVKVMNENSVIILLILLVLFFVLQPLASLQLITYSHCCGKPQLWGLLPLG